MNALAWLNSSQDDTEYEFCELPFWVCQVAADRVRTIFREAGYVEADASEITCLYGWDNKNVIIWEEGPFEWTTAWIEKINDALDGLAVFAEPVNNSVLALVAH